MGIAIIWLAAAPLGAAPPPATQAPSAGYDDMTARLRAAGNAIDPVAPRRAASAPPHDDGYGRLGMTALAAYDWRQLRTPCDRRLAHDDLDLDAQPFETYADEKFGRPAQADLHRRIPRGPVDAIRAGGDGLSAKTAWRVIGVDEDHVLLQILHPKSGRQSLVMQDGAFDVLDTVDAPGVRRDMRFDISSGLGGSRA